MARTNLYNAVWRWHFYAGLLTLPVLILLSITGSIYLFKDEINDPIYSDLLRVASRQSTPALTVSDDRPITGIDHLTVSANCCYRLGTPSRPDLA